MWIEGRFLVNEASALCDRSEVGFVDLAFNVDWKGGPRAIGALWSV